MTTIANFSIEYTQYLDPEGKATGELPEFAQDHALLEQLYRQMVITRAFDAKAVNLQRTGKMGTFASSLGQEAIGTALGSVMQENDVLCPSYRDQAAMFQRGTRLEDVLLYWGGNEYGSDFATHREDLPICVPIATQCLLATGVASAFKIRGEQRVAVTLCGDGASSKGDFLEAINVAGAWQLPVVFIINNNQWAISVPRSEQCGAETLAQKGIGAGLHAEQVDGNDILAVRDRLSVALDKARRGEGASVLEMMTYRLHDHTTADDAKRYRDEAELKAAWQKDPIKRLKQYLITHAAWTEAKDEALLNEASQLVETAAENYFNTPPGPPESILDFLFAELPVALYEQREDISKFAGGQHG